MPVGRPARLQVDIIADAKGVAKGTAEAEGRFGKLGGKLGKFGAVAGAALAGVGVAAAGMAFAAVKSASSLEQSMGAVGTVFGKSAKAVEQYAATSSTRLGLAKSEYNSLAALVGTSMKNIGKSQAEAAVDTDALIARASDLAATFGGSTKEATEALGAAFRGEYDSIERLGISMSANAVQAELVKRGQAGLTGAALEAAKGQATLDLIMLKSKETHGAFGREANTLAGTQERLRAKFEDVKATVGTALLPMLTSLGQWVLTHGVPALQKLGEWARTRLLPALRALGDFVRDKMVPVLRDTFKPIVDGIKSAFDRVSTAVGKNRGAFDKLKPLIEKVGEVMSVAAPIVGTVFGEAFRLAGDVISTVVTTIGKLIDFIDSAIRKFDELRTKVGDVVGGISAKVDQIGGLLGKLPGLSLEVTPMITGPIVGPVGGLGPNMGGWATAALGDSFLYGGGGVRARIGTQTGGVRTVNMPITINGALDPVAVAHQLERVLRDAAIRLGKAPAFGW